jgi:hypothetical protein
VQAEKTQRDKDWPMIRRLVEAHYFENRGVARLAQVEFWLREMRTPELLLAVAERHPAAARRLTRTRKLLALACDQDMHGVTAALESEERAERERDRKYWAPLRRELETLRHRR